MIENTLSSNLGRIKDATDEIRTTLDMPNASVEELASAVIAPPEGTINITDNGTINVSQYATASVNVPKGITPTGTKSITNNGITDVTNYANVDVNVPGIIPTGTINITQNGNVDVTQYANANVNVSGGGGGDKDIYEVSSDADLVDLKATANIGDKALVHSQNEIPLSFLLHEGEMITELTLPDTFETSNPPDWFNADISFVSTGSGMPPRLGINGDSERLMIDYMDDDSGAFFIADYTSNDGGLTYNYESGEGHTIKINKNIDYIYVDGEADFVLDSIVIEDVTTEGLYELKQSAIYNLNNVGVLSREIHPFPFILFNVKTHGGTITEADFVGFSRYNADSTLQTKLYQQNNKIYMDSFTTNNLIEYYHYHGDIAQLEGSLLIGANETVCINDWVASNFSKNLGNNWYYIILNENIYSRCVDMDIYDGKESSNVYRMLTYYPKTQGLAWFNVKLGLSASTQDIVAGKTALTNYGVETGTYGLIFKDKDIAQYNALCQTIEQHLITDSRTLESLKNETSLPVVKLIDTSALTSLDHTFANFQVEELDLNHWDTSNVTNMYCTFANCNNLHKLMVENWDTSQVTNMGSLFNGSYIDYIDISNWDTSNVTDMSYMFYYSNTWANIDFSVFDTSSVTNLSYMFANATRGSHALTELDLTNFDVSNVTNMSYMFYLDNPSSTQGLIELDLSTWDTRNVTDITCMFCGQYRLSKLDIRNFDFSAVTKWNLAFNFGTVSSTAWNCLIIVKSDVEKNWLTTNFPKLINVKTVAEYEGGNN